MRRMSDADIVILPGDRPCVSGAGAGTRPKTDVDRAQARPKRTRDAGTAKTKRERAPKPAPKSKRRPPRIWLTPVQKIAAIGLLLVALAGGGAVWWHSGAPARLGNDMLALTARAGFKVGRIVVTGRDRTTNAQIVSALGVRVGTPILGIDLAAAQARLQAIPTVALARVERHLPGTVTVALTERQPVAVWQRPDGTFTLIGRLGHAIPGPVSGYGALPLVVGPGAPKATAALLDMLATEPGMAPRVKAAVRVGERRWNLFLYRIKGGLMVELPENGAETAWRRLARLEGDHGLTRRGIAMVDLRLPDRMILRMSDKTKGGAGKSPARAPADGA